MTLRMRHLAEVNPPTPEFDRLSSGSAITFVPLEAVWADSRLDLNRSRTKSEVSVGYTRFRDGDVIVPKVTPTFQAARSTVVANLVNGVGAGSTELHVLRARPGVDARFLQYVVRSQPFLTEGVSAFQGVAGLQRVTDEFVKDFPVATFSLEQQRRIADFLDAEAARIDGLMAIRGRQLELSEQRKWILTSDRVAGRTQAASRIQSLAWLGGVSADWRIARLGTLARIHMGTTFPDRYQGEPVGDFPFVKVADFASGNATDELSSAENWVTRPVARELRARVVPKGSILYARVGAALLLNQRRILTRDCIVDDNVRGVEFRMGNQRYWLYVMKLIDLAQVANPGIVPSVNESQIRSLRLPLPSRAEQDTIVEELDQLHLQMSELRSLFEIQLTRLKERRQALITAAVTGQIDVTTARGVEDS